MRCLFLCFFLITAPLTYTSGQSDASQRDSLRLLREIFLITLKGHPEKSIPIAERSLYLAQRLDDSMAKGEAHYNIGQGYYFIGQYAQAMINYRQAKKILAAVGEKKILADVYNATGNCYVEVEDYASALTSYKRALALMSPGSTTQIKLFNNIGSVNILIKRYDSAEFYFARMIELSKGDPRQKLVYLNNTAYVNYELARYDKSISLYRNGINIAEALKEQIYLPRFYKNLGDCYLRMGSYDSCFKYLNKSLTLSRETKRYAQEVDVLLSLSAYYDSLGNPRQALTQAEKARIVSASTTNFNYGKLFSALSRLHSKDGDFGKALYYEQRNTAYLDSVRMAKQRQSISPEPEDLVLLKPVSSTRNVVWIVAGIVTTGILFFAYTIFYRRQRRHENTPEKIIDGPPLADDRYIKGQHQGGETLVSIDEIIWFEKEERLYYARTADVKYRIRPTISELENIVPRSFVRINRSVIINLAFLLNYSSWENNKYVVRLKLPEGTKFISTRDRIKQIEERLLS
jgi:tetratricopeptide (TPR) repeat protein